MRLEPVWQALRYTVGPLAVALKRPPEPQVLDPLAKAEARLDTVLPSPY